MRNHNQEYQDNQDRRYSYDFDTVIRRYMLRAFEPQFVRGGSVLELGCHRGDMTEQILEYFPAVTAIEAASDLVEGVRARFPGRVSVVAATFEDAVLADRFDNLFLIHTLEHLDHPVDVLKRVRQWLTPQGRLFVAVPNANALSRQIAVRMGLIEHNSAVTPAEAQHGHRRTYSMDALLSDVRRAGYHVDDHGGILVKPLANFQFDQALAAGIVNEAYLRGCHELAKTYPDLSASLYAVCSLPA